jgi:hypothetical protein
MPFKGKPVHEELSESHFVSALVAMTLAGDVLSPGIITKHTTDHPDANGASFFQSTARDSSEKVFVTRSIFCDYLLTVVLPLIQGVRSELKNPASPAILIFDGHQAHMSQIIRAFAAQHIITLFLLPPHSSHLLQPLDQGFFRPVKTQFGQFARTREFSKRTSTCECVFMALQATFVTRIIWNSCAQVGIVPVIESGKCTRSELDWSRILRDPAIHHGPLPIQENARGSPVCKPQFGVLNQAESEPHKSGCCPFCERPLEISDQEK